MNAQLNRARILLVEDSEEDALLFKRYCQQIKEYSWEIDHVVGCSSARSTFTEGPHDLYYIDYRLPPDNGIQLIRELQALRYQVPIILMTGADEANVSEQALIAGATEFISKNELSPKLIARSARHACIRLNAEKKMNSLVA